MSRDNFQWDDVQQVADDFSDVKRMHNARADLIKEMNPVVRMQSMRSL